MAMRTEQEIFDDLAKLCASPGYIHALAFLCFRDNLLATSGELTAELLLEREAKSPLIRTEISTLIGLLIRTEIDYFIPEQHMVQTHIERTDLLLKELHDAMSAVWLTYLTPEAMNTPGFNPFATADVLREPIFYGSESAYTFQYRDFSGAKYARDDAWLRRTKGFAIEDAVRLVRVLTDYLNNQHIERIKKLRLLPQALWTMLPTFTFAANDLAAAMELPLEQVEGILSTFTLPPDEKNAGFVSLHEFNVANAFPFIRDKNGHYILFQYASLVEALYDAPFYWMCDDKAYAQTALNHRGEFAEALSYERLTHVFGADNVYRNVRIFRGKAEIGEIDVLALFGHSAIVLQAKSKKLTLEARKGNDQQIKDDFKKAAQAAYDQAILCANALLDASNSFVLDDGNTLPLKGPIKVIYPICVVADHYQALAFQAKQFLIIKSTDVIRPPLVTDVFALDTMTEMLASPLRLLSYLQLRTRFDDKLLAMHENTLLGFHLKSNLWVKDDTTFISVDDSVATHLDVAMAVRRDEMPGAPEPDGILTRFKSTPLGQMIDQIESEPNEQAIEFGLLLLQMGEEAAKLFNDGINRIMEETRRNSEIHDFSMGLEGGGGLSVHCNKDGASEAALSRLRSHSELRKYSQKQDRWLGAIIDPIRGRFCAITKLEFPWRKDAHLDALLRKFKSRRKGIVQIPKQRKIGRNEPCPCGSGRKFKKCCGANALD